MEVRTAVFGKEVSKYKEDEDEYPIELRYKLDQRTNIDKILNLKITYRHGYGWSYKTNPFVCSCKYTV